MVSTLDHRPPNYTSHKAGEFSKEDYSRLIEFIEPCRPIWDHKMNLSERSENIKDRFWNQVFVQFEGKLFQINLADTII